MASNQAVFQTQSFNYSLPPSPPPEPSSEVKLATHSPQSAPRSLTSATGGTTSGATPRLGYAASTSSQANVYQPQPQPYYTQSGMHSTYGQDRSRSPNLAAVGHGHDHNQTLSAILYRLLVKSRELLPFISSSSLSLPSHSELNASTSTAHPNLVRSTLAMVPSADAFRYAGLCSLWYTSSALSNNTGKSILANFRYPVTLTLVQFGFVAGYGVLFCAAREQLAVSRAKATGYGNMHGRKNSIFLMNGRLSGLTVDWGLALASWGIRKPSKTALHGTLVMSLFQIAGHVFSSMAIARVPVSTVHTIKALSPLFTVLSYAILFRVRYSASTYTALVPLTLGVMLACSFDIRANAIGLICALGSTVIFVSQNIFSKKLLPKENPAPTNLSASPMARSSSQPSSTTASASGVGKLDKVNLLLYSSGMAFLLMIPIWIYTDLSALLAPKPTPVNPVPASYLFGLFLLNGSVHFAQCLLAFSILARSTPVAYSIASLIKRVAVICLAIVWFGQQIRFIQAFGMAMTFTGLWMYNRAKTDVDKGERKRASVEKRHFLVLPTTTNDVHRLSTTTTGGLGGFTPDLSPSVTPLPSSGTRSEYIVPSGAPPGQPSSLQLMYGAPPPHSTHSKPMDAIPAWVSSQKQEAIEQNNRQRQSFSSGSPNPPVLVSAR